MPASASTELGFVEHRAERRDGELEVVVLLHVEVDERARRARAARNTIRSRSAIRSTLSSQAQWLSWEAMAEIFTDT